MTKKLLKKINKTKGEIIEVGHLLYQKGLIAGSDGNISVCIGQKRMITTCSGIHKGFMKKEHMTEIDFSEIFEEDLKVSGCRPSTEAMMHVLIYKHSPDLKAIIHAHCPWATALSLTAKDGSRHIDLTPLVEGRLIFGKVPLVPDLPPGTRELAEAVAMHFPENRAVIMKAHGAVTAGKDLNEALSLIEALEHNCRILGIARTLKAP